MKLIAENNTQKKTENIEDVNPSFMAPKRNKKEQEDVLKEVGQYIATIKAKRSAEEIRKTQLLQLKFTIQDYLNDTTHTTNFGFFLHKYIEILGKKDKEFASDIHLNRTELSQILNNRRNPANTVFFKLAEHSNNNIPAFLWFFLSEKKKIYEFLESQPSKSKIKKEVRNKLEFSI